MKIKKLTINSFRGLKNMEFNLQEKLNVFEGKNELGKTSVVDSVLWVLAGDTLVYGKQDSDNRNEHNLKDVINVILEMDNGLVLERKYFDVWKEDSDGNLKFSRTENQFFINGAKYKVQEYFDFIKESIGLKTIIKPKEINLLRALIDYNYLSSIDYKITREFYEGVLGLQSDLELLSQEKYGLIATDMQKLKCDMGKSKHKYATALKEIEKEIETTNSILQMKEKSIDSEKLENYDRYIGERMELLKTNVNEESEYLRLNKELEQNSINIQEEQKNVLEALNHATELRSEYIQKGNEVKNQFIALEKLVKSNNEKIEFHREKGINHYERLIEQERSSVFKSVNCPHCGKSLNDNDKSVYERNKKELINNYQREIEKTKETINVLTKSTTSANDKCKKLEEEFNELQNQYNDNELRIKELNEEKQSNTKVNELLLEKERLTNELNLFINNYNNSK